MLAKLSKMTNVPAALGFNLVQDIKTLAKLEMKKRVPKTLCLALSVSDASFPVIKLGAPFSTKALLEVLLEKGSLVTGTAVELKISTDNCNASES